ncbi:MAG: tetraacyldisaccharide 4'-kinase [Polyangiaceae bacterium]
MLAVAAFLEQGRLGPPAGRLERAAVRALGKWLGRTVVRRLSLPAGVPVVCIGGATLGGSGKTPLAIACAAALARAFPGRRVALVGHAYRAAPRRARIVRPDDPVEEVGDEALVAVQALASLPPDASARASVVVAPTRQGAIDHAARAADVLVLDGVTQTAPARAALALLAVDAAEPWGRAVAVPPWGDLRAPVPELLRSVDRVVALGDGDVKGAWSARVVTPGARLGHEILVWEALRPLRVGLVCALARPERVLRRLACQGVFPSVVLRTRDHGPGARAHGEGPPPGPRVDLWLATSKCAQHVAKFGFCRPLAVLEHSVELPADVVAALTAVGGGNTLETSRNVSQKAE